MRGSKRVIAELVCLVALSLLSGCGTGSDATQQFSVSGSVSGLSAGESLVLENNGEVSSVIVSANGPFSFPTLVAANSSYHITVDVQPAGQVCTISDGSGAGVTADVTNVAVACAGITFSISGTVTGLAQGTSVVLTNNGSDPLTQLGNGPFTFSSPIAFGSSYAIAVSTQPANETCTVSNAMGAGVVSDVSNVSVVCSTEAFSIGGIVSGLDPGLQVTLDLNGSNPLTLVANGAFAFSGMVAAQGSYVVTVGTEPTNQTCTVSGGSGSGVEANVTGVVATCSQDTYTIGGVLSGLASGMQVTLENNAANPQTLAANGPFTFVTPVALLGSYAVTVATQPVGQTCSVSGGLGSSITANVTTVSINCQ